jgi:hypothetical protein
MANRLQRLAARALGLVTQDQLEAVAEALDSRRDAIADPLGYTLISADGSIVVDTESLRRIQQEAQRMWQADPLIKQAVRVKRHFILGAGITFTAEDPDIDELLHAAWRDPLEQMPEQLTDWTNSLLVTCELCLRFFEAPNGDVRVRQIPFNEIYDVIPDPEDRNRILYIWRKYPRRTFSIEAKAWKTEQVDEFVPGEDIIWVVTNRIPGTVRGIPDLYAALNWAKAYTEWLQDRMKLNKAKGAWAWIRKVKGTAGQVAAKAAQLAGEIGGKVKTALGVDTDDKEKDRKPPKPGSVITTNENVEWDVINAQVKADDAKEDGRAVKLQVAAAANIFEHYFGDASEANLASAKAMELPMLREYETAQGLLGRIISQVFRRKLEAKVKAGRLPDTYAVPRETLKDGALTEEKVEKKTVDCPVDVNWPPLKQEEDRLKRAQAAEIEQRMEVKSTATIASELGVEDWEQEKARLFKERQEREARATEDTTNQYPPFNPPNPGGNQQPGDQGAQGPDAQGQGGE